MPDLAPGDRRHGMNGYQNLRCRCDVCRKSVADYHRDYMHRTGRQRPLEVHLAEIRANPPAHGTETRYTGPDKCRCDECKKASREARARRRAKAAG